MPTFAQQMIDIWNYPFLSKCMITPEVWNFNSTFWSVLFQNMTVNLVVVWILWKLISFLIMTYWRCRTFQLDCVLRMVTLCAWETQIIQWVECKTILHNFKYPPVLTKHLWIYKGLPDFLIIRVDKDIPYQSTEVLKCGSLVFENNSYVLVID